MLVFLKILRTYWMDGPHSTLLFVSFLYEHGNTLKTRDRRTLSYLLQGKILYIYCISCFCICTFVRDRLQISHLILSEVINSYSAWSQQKTIDFIINSEGLDINTPVKFIFLLNLLNIRIGIWRRYLRVRTYVHAAIHSVTYSLHSFFIL